MKLKFIVKEQIILREFLIKKEISKKTLTRIKFDKDGSIKVNGQEQNVRFLLNTDDSVEITLPSEQFSDNVRFINEKINILYEDEYLLVVDKPKNLPTIPSRNNEDESLLEYINYYFKNNNYTTVPHIVTRLDKNTSGIVLVAKHRHVHAMFNNVKFEKYYLALAHGKTPDNIIIEANIAREENSIITRKVDASGDYAKTELTTIKYIQDKNCSLIKLKLFTGRTHQIRVHCKHIGHPLLGDELYGGNTLYIKRHALHCNNIIFQHPITKKEINIISELHNDMKNLIK